jgi:hypothetical protein
LVTPLVGVWIEMLMEPRNHTIDLVTPLVGVWIEMSLTILCLRQLEVTPLAGVWIKLPKIGYPSRMLHLYLEMILLNKRIIREVILLVGYYF